MVRSNNSTLATYSAANKSFGTSADVASKSPSVSNTPVASSSPKDSTAQPSQYSSAPQSSPAQSNPTKNV